MLRIFNEAVESRDYLGEDEACQTCGCWNKSNCTNQQFTQQNNARPGNGEQIREQKIIGKLVDKHKWAA